MRRAAALAGLLSACSVARAEPVRPAPTVEAAPVATVAAASPSPPVVIPTPTSMSVLAFAATASPTSAAPAATASPTPTATPLPIPTLIPVTRTLSAAQRLEVFEATWRFVRDNYVYPDFLGVNWNSVREEFLPRVRATAGTAQFYDLMRAMVARLPDGHSLFRDPVDTQWATLVRFGAPGASISAIGANLLWTPDGNYVVHAFPGFAAARDGLRDGDLIVAVNGAFPSGAERSNGMPGSPGPVRLTLRSPDGALREIRTQREALGSDRYPPAVLSRMLNATKIGLITIYTFRQRDLATHVRAELEALAKNGPLDGLIIDVRANYGGLIDAMRETMALIVAGGAAGRMEGRYNPYDIEIPAGAALPRLKGVPVAVLVSENTNSAGEMFAASLRALGRAVVVGMPSKGNTENIVYQPMPYGSSLVLSVRLFELPDGTTIEGRGVPLDVRVEARWWRFATETDPQVLAALEALRGTSVHP